MNFRVFIIPLIILLSGFVLTIIGILFKIMYWPYSVEAFIFGTGLIAVALILGIINLILIYRKGD